MADDKSKKPNIGKIVSIRGPVLDIEFPPGKLPDMNTALEIYRTEDKRQKYQRKKIIAEVQQSIGSNQVRAVAMSPTDGLDRGMSVTDTGKPIEVPVGQETLGRLFNVLGEPIDSLGEVSTKMKLSIHREPPSIEDIEPTTELFETGVKVIDLLCPFIKGGKIGMFGGAGVGKT
ncbi:MAG: F0F1 ATP synthase subunit beta, partial [Actinomycetia bacterium]|nr:F0F1 ATP synthase subunit beta [Actinomycetes bacterium]